jgi:iron complex outermembrane receptor protein
MARLGRATPRSSDEGNLHMSLKKLAAGVALTTLAALIGTQALAQSTASQVAEVVVTTNRQQAVGGVAVQSQVAKDQSVVTSQFIATQVGSANAAQLINMLPGVTYSSEDPTGLLSSDLRIHGFDGAHISVTIDGTPVNDTGNYAVYPGEYIPAEVTDRITVNMGGNEVDSPSASALGSTVNIVSKMPTSTPGFLGSVSGGSYDYIRGYAEGDTGEFTPWGTKAWLSANYASSDKYKGDGTLNRKGVDFRVYQPIRDTDFISVAGTWVSERSFFYYDATPPQYAQYGRNLDYNTAWIVPSVTPGKADTVPSGPKSDIAYAQGDDSNFWALHPNPVDFGDIRVQSRFDLSHKVTLTVDPYFFYTLANGGGTTSLKENDPRLAGNTGKTPCVDLNGDGDCLDTVMVYSPSNTQTDRYGINTSLLWDPDDHNHFQLSYTHDYGNHRQTGAYSPINQGTGTLQTYFAGFDGQGIYAMDGSPLRKRDRFSVAELNQYSFNYIGRWFDDKLHINVGVREANFTRRLNQYCYDINGTNDFCDSVSLGTGLAAYATDLAANRAPGATATALTALAGTTISTGPGGFPNIRLPFTQTYHFDQALPNAGASWNFNSSNQIYVSYSEGFSAPQTDDLYTSAPELVKPETTDNFAGGYRYQSSKFTLTASGWGAIWHNHIVRSYDPDDPTTSIDRNVGEVSLYGIDFDASLHPIDPLMLYASITLEHSQLDSNYSQAVSGKTIYIPAKGKELVMTPDQMFTARVQYTIGPLKIGIDGKYTGQRYTDDINSNNGRIPGFTAVNLDAEYAVPNSGGHVVLQLNADNILNAQYLVRTTTASNYAPITANGVTLFASSGPFFYNAAPPTVYGTLKVKF